MPLNVSHATTPPPVVRLERAAAVSARVGLSRPRIYALMQRGEFPVPVKIHGRSVAWRSDEIDHWIATRPRAGGPINTNAPGGSPEASRPAHVVA